MQLKKKKSKVMDGDSYHNQTLLLMDLTAIPMKHSVKSLESNIFGSSLLSFWPKRKRTLHFDLYKIHPGCV